MKFMWYAQNYEGAIKSSFMNVSFQSKIIFVISFILKKRLMISNHVTKLQGIVLNPLNKQRRFQ